MLHYQSDEIRANNLARLIQDGYSKSIMVSQDSFCSMLGKKPGYIEETIETQERHGVCGGRGHYLQTHLFTEFLPMLRKRGVSEENFWALIEENPANFFMGVPPLNRQS
jgi:phosphotriesterase-related protein